MSKTSVNCRVPSKIDADIASHVLGWNKSTVATLISEWEDDHKGQAFDVSDTRKAADILVQYNRDKLGKDARKRLNEAFDHKAESYKSLAEVYDSKPQTRLDRINMIASMFTKALDKWRSIDPAHSRSEYIEGFEEDGIRKGGQAAIFGAIYKQLRARYEQLMSVKEGDPRYKDAKYLAEECAKMLDNWPALTVLARIKLRDIEGVNLGTKLDYSYESDADSFGENDLGLIYNAEESTRESWQMMNDYISAFSTLGKQVRRVLGELVEKKDGKAVLDDFGYPRKINPIRAHQLLMDQLRGVIDQADMMAAIQEAARDFPWMEDLHRMLSADPDLKTEFFNNFNKDFQLYKSISRTLVDGIYKIKTTILNKLRNPLVGAFKANIYGGKVLNEASIYDERGRLNEEKVKTFIKDIRSLLQEPVAAEESSNILIAQKKEPSNFWATSESDYWKKQGLHSSQQVWAARGRIISDAAKSIGINLEPDVAERILRTQGKKFTDEFLGLANYGFDKSAVKTGKSYIKVYSNKTQSSNKKGDIEEHVEKILESIAKHTTDLKYESRATRRDKTGKYKTLYSNVYPSFLGTFIKIINRYANKKDLVSLRKFLDNTYGKSSMFKLKDGNNEVWLNAWLDDFYNDNLSSGVNPFAEALNFSRFLGSEELDFEDMTSKQHAITMLSDFSFAENTVRTKTVKSADGRGYNKVYHRYANYPVFVLGDSGVSKTIKAPIYSYKEIVNALYNLYRSEIRKQELAKAAIEKLTSEGYNSDKHLTAMSSKFSILKFLNDPGIQNTIVEQCRQGVSEETAVKNAIEAALITETEKFKAELDNLGLLETTTDKEGKVKYVYLDQNIKALNNLSGIQVKTADDFIKLFYWNTKLATALQVQITTIDADFYNNVKDLQKRYKEIHAPGTPCSVDHPDGKKIETCMYFDDIKINTKDFNPEFMDVIRNTYGEDSDVYKAYSGVSLTDGQGFRTLRSYRQVMKMTSKWTDEMEAAYNRIQEIRDQYKDSEIPNELLSEMSNLAVTFMPIKPSTFTHEHYPLNDGDHLIIPVYHKYAEAVIIPELMAKDSMLRALGLAMENHRDKDGNSDPIDMVCATTAVKVGAFGTTSLEGCKSQEEIEAALSKGYVHRLNYSDYRIQTNVPDHIMGSRLFATQIRKLIMSNLDMNKSYDSYVGGEQVCIGKDENGNNIITKLNGRNLLNFYNGLIVANMLESYKEFEDVIKNPQRLADLLQQAVVNNDRESWDNLYAYCLESIGDEQNLNFPIFEGNLEHDSAALLLSVFRKKVNKQKINGGSLVQVSALGIKDYEVDGGLAFVCADENGNIIRSTDPDYEQKKHLIKNVLYAECEVPFDLSVNIDGKEVALQWEDWCNEDGTLKTDEDGVPLLEKKFPKILNRIAYRIPTERDYSILNLKIVRFSPRVSGGTIKVPAQGTTIAGFDFDIDKLFFMMREYHFQSDKNAQSPQSLFSSGNIANNALVKNLNEEDVRKLQEAYQSQQGPVPEGRLLTYNLSKSPLEQHKNKRIATALRNNMLIDLIQARLEDLDTLKERVVPGGFPQCSTAARMFRELEYSPIESITEGNKVSTKKLEKRAEIKDADPEPDYDFTDPMTIIRFNQQNQIAAKLIGIFANQNTNYAYSTLMNKFQLVTPILFAGKTVENGYGKDLLHGPEGVDVGRNMAELLAASVDAVKDPVLNYLNFNTITADAAALLIRLGYSPFEVGMLLKQPIIKDLCEHAFNNNIGVRRALIELRDRYENQLKDITGGRVPEYSPNDFTEDKLLESLLKDRKANENSGVSNYTSDAKELVQQLKVLNFFDFINTTAGEVKGFISSTRFTAANAVGATFGHLYAQQQQVLNYIKSVNSKDSNLDIRLTETSRNVIDVSSKLLDKSKEEYFLSVINDGHGNPFAFEQCMYDLNRRALRALCKYYPYDTPLYSEMRDRATRLTSKNYLDEDTINTLHRDLLSYLLASVPYSYFNGDSIMNYEGSKITYRDYFLKEFPREVFTELNANPEYKTKYAIFDYLTAEYDNNENKFRLSMANVGSLTPQEKDLIRDSWKALLKDDPMMAQYLFMYTYYDKGFKFSHDGFGHLCPIAVKETIKVNSATSYKDFLRKVLRGESSIGFNNFLAQFILNHTDNKSLVYTSRGDVDKKLRGLATDSKGYWKSTFTIDLGNLESTNPIILKQVQDGFYVVPCIKFNDGYGEVLYMLDYNAASDNFNYTEGTAVFRRVYKLDNTYVAEGSNLPSEIIASDKELLAPMSNSSSTIYSELEESNYNRGIWLHSILTKMVSEESIQDAAARENLRNWLSALDDAELKAKARDLGLIKEPLIDSTGKKVC